MLWVAIIGRDGQIRTADPSHPKRVLYQAEPRPDITQPVHNGGPAFGVIDSLHGCAVYTAARVRCITARAHPSPELESHPQLRETPSLRGLARLEHEVRPAAAQNG